ncbi:hypothetical protein BDR26DRAFT_1011107 [Obelidium mucronatum]|nr:hypothetical protein BDR26DRAFT_1011107 [Obelidium mucronatum]
MSKRVADTYLTNVDSHPMDNDEEAPTGEFARASEEKLKKRAIVAPKRRAAAPATPAASSAFSGFSFGAAAPTPAASVPAAVQPAKKPDSFTPAAAAPEVLTASLAKEAGESAAKQPTVTPETKLLAQAVRGLNVSFLEFVKAALLKDPFADLSVAAQKYTAHYNEVTSKHTDAIRVLKERSTNVVSKTLTSDLKPTPASASPSTSTPAAAPAVTGGFTFGTPSKSRTEPTTAGGFTFGIASNSSGIKTPAVAGGFTFNAPSPSQPPKPSTPAAVEASKP